MLAVIKKIFSFVGGGKGTFIAISVAVAVGTASGWWAKTKLVEADMYQQAQLALQAQKEAVERIADQYEAQISINNEVTNDYINGLLAVNKQKPKIIKEIQYVESKPECDVPVGVISVLNIARTGGDAGVQISNPAKDPDGKIRPTPPVTQRDEYEAHAECGFRYQELSEKHNRLIDWIEKNSK